MSMSVANGLLELILVIALVTDLRDRRIYNWLTFPGVLLGLGIQTYHFGLIGLFNGLLGALAASAVFLLGFILGRMMGAGDVKLMAVVGAFLGFPACLGAVIWVTLIGGIVSILVPLFQGQLKPALNNVKNQLQALLYARTITTLTAESSAVKPLPYGVSIFIGMSLYFLWPKLFLF
jgi:prepilin peptidase CpaA